MKKKAFITHCKSMGLKDVRYSGNTRTMYCKTGSPGLFQAATSNLTTEFAVVWDNGHLKPEVTTHDIFL